MSRRVILWDRYRVRTSAVPLPTGRKYHTLDTIPKEILLRIIGYTIDPLEDDKMITIRLHGPERLKMTLSNPTSPSSVSTGFSVTPGLLLVNKWISAVALERLYASNFNFASSQAMIKFLQAVGAQNVAALKTIRLRLNGDLMVEESFFQKSALALMAPALPLRSLTIDLPNRKEGTSPRALTPEIFKTITSNKTLTDILIRLVTDPAALCGELTVFELNPRPSVPHHIHRGLTSASMTVKQKAKLQDLLLMALVRSCGFCGHRKEVLANHVREEVENLYLLSQQVEYDQTEESDKDQDGGVDQGGVDQGGADQGGVEEDSDESIFGAFIPFPARDRERPIPNPQPSGHVVEENQSDNWYNNLGDGDNDSGHQQVSEQQANNVYGPE